MFGPADVGLAGQRDELLDGSDALTVLELLSAPIKMRSVHRRAGRRRLLPNRRGVVCRAVTHRVNLIHSPRTRGAGGVVLR
jgi:hypothetical protein